MAGLVAVNLGVVNDPHYELPRAIEARRRWKEIQERSRAEAIDSLMKETLALSTELVVIHSQAIEELLARPLQERTIEVLTQLVNPMLEQLRADNIRNFEGVLEARDEYLTELTPARKQALTERFSASLQRTIEEFRQRILQQPFEPIDPRNELSRMIEVREREQVQKRARIQEIDSLMSKTVALNVELASRYCELIEGLLARPEEERTIEVLIQLVDPMLGQLHADKILDFESLLNANDFCIENGQCVELTPAKKQELTEEFSASLQRTIEEFKQRILVPHPSEI